MMHVHILAVGRLRDSPERRLVDDFLAQFNRITQGLGMGPATVTEIIERKNGGRVAETRLLQASVPKRAVVCLLDERGATMTSPSFAEWLERLRDEGTPHLAFMIGGADGVDPDFRARADQVMSFGAMVWPHKLVRVMLAEQLYRAVTILAGTPYHRS